MVSQLPDESPIEVRSRSLWSGRRWWLGFAVAFVGLAIGMTVVLVNLRSQLLAKRNRLNQIAWQQRITLRWMEVVPVPHFYYRFFKQLPNTVADYVQDVGLLSASDEGLELPPIFFQELNACRRIARVDWKTPRYSSEVANLLTKQRRLFELTFVTRNLQDHDFEWISHSPQLITLEVDGLESPELHGAFLRGAVGLRPKLHDLRLLHMNLSAGACQSIGRLTSLRFLELTGSSLTSELGNSLAGLRLLSLAINETLVDDRFGATLATMMDLRTLKVKGTPLTAAGLENLEYCQELLVLETGGKRGGAKLLSHLCKCTKLRSLDVVWSGQFSAADIANFNKLPDTGYLYFEDVGDDEAEHLRQCEHLTGLDIHSRRMTLAGVRSLIQMADLRHLKLDGQNWGPELVDVLYESQTLETVKILDRLWEWWEFEDLRKRLEVP